MSEQHLEMTVGDKELAFDIDMTAYNGYINSMMPKDKVAPAHNFLMKTVTPESKDDLKEVLKLPGAAIQITGALIEAYAPALEVVVKKPKASLTA